jgi:hypothetical protein
VEEEEEEAPWKAMEEDVRSSHKYLVEMIGLQKQLIDPPISNTRILFLLVMLRSRRVQSSLHVIIALQNHLGCCFASSKEEKTRLSQCLLNIVF